jgi:hypothetical protein
VKDEMKEWIYSWMQGVVTIAKYEVSKVLLLEWSLFAQVEAAVGTTILENLKSWIILKRKILPFVNKTLLATGLNKGRLMSMLTLLWGWKGLL